MWYLLSNALSLLRANVVLVNVIGMTDTAKYPYLRRPFKSSLQALLSSYMGSAMVNPGNSLLNSFANSPMWNGNGLADLSASGFEKEDDSGDIAPGDDLDINNEIQDLDLDVDDDINELGVADSLSDSDDDIDSAHLDRSLLVKSISETLNQAAADLIREAQTEAMSGRGDGDSSTS